MHADIIKQLYQEKYGFKLSKPANTQESIDKLNLNESQISPEFADQVEELQVIIFNRLQPFKL